MAEAKTTGRRGLALGSQLAPGASGRPSCSRRNSWIFRTAPGGSPIRLLRTRANSCSTTSPVTKVCSESTTRSTSAQIPLVANALTRTLVSRKTLDERLAQHPRLSGIPAPPRTAGLAVGGARVGAGSTAVGGHPAGEPLRVRPVSLEIRSRSLSRSGSNRTVTADLMSYNVLHLAVPRQPAPASRLPRSTGHLPGDGPVSLQLAVRTRLPEALRQHQDARGRHVRSSRLLASGGDGRAWASTPHDARHGPGERGPRPGVRGPEAGPPVTRPVQPLLSREVGGRERLSESSRPCRPPGTPRSRTRFPTGRLSKVLEQPNRRSPRREGAASTPVLSKVRSRSKTRLTH